MDDFSSESKPGYYKEKTSRNRDRNDVVGLNDVAREEGSYVRAVDAFKVPVDKEGVPMGLKEGNKYDLEGFTGEIGRGAKDGRSVARTVYYIAL